jgi:hypothetical protein
LKRLIPLFLKKLDSYLLLNHPTVWISKIHFVLFYGIITWALSALSGIAIPINLSQTQDLGLWYFLFTILAIIALCFWIYHNIIFNLEKKYGKRQWTDEYKVLLLNVLCVFVFISFPIPFTGIYNARVANTVTDEEFINDINSLNRADAYMITNITNYSYEYDSVTGTSNYDLRNPVQFDSYTPWVLKSDTLRFKNLASNYDIAKAFDPMKSDMQIKLLVSNYINVRRKFESDAYSGVSADSLMKRTKYLWAHSPMNNEEFYNSYNTYNGSYELERIFNNIAEAKYGSFFLWKFEFLNVILYACLYLSMLLMLFKMVPWKQFLLTFISFIILPILLFIISQLLPYGSGMERDTTYLMLMVLTLVAAVVFTALGALPSRQFNPFKNICAQITYLAAPVLPVTILFLVKTFFYSSLYGGSYDVVEMAIPGETITTDPNYYYNTWTALYNQLLQNYWSEWFDRWIFISLYGGLILFVIVIMPVMKQLFVKQLALPRKS